MATVGTNRPGGYDHHHHHHQNPLQNDDEFSLRHMMDAEPNGPDSARDVLSGSSSIPAAGDASGNGVVDITAAQKMVSAMSGSLLTSLLGMSLFLLTNEPQILTCLVQSHLSMLSAYASNRKKLPNQSSISPNSLSQPPPSPPPKPPNWASHHAVAKSSSPAATPNSVSQRPG